MLGPESVAPGGHESTASPGLLTGRPPLSFRRLRPPRSRGTASAGRVSGAGSGSKARRRKAQSTNEWVAAVEDLKTRHAAAAPIRAPLAPSPQDMCFLLPRSHSDALSASDPGSQSAASGLGAATESWRGSVLTKPSGCS